jgi:hypothetical protein
MKIRLFVLLLSLCAAGPTARAVPLDPALQDKEWLLETLLYSYYWYLDDAFFAAAAGKYETEIWVRSTEPHARDAGDHSRFGELWFPSAKVLLAVKQADYFIPEFNLPVQNAGYRVIRGSFEPEAPAAATEWKVIVLAHDQVSATLQSARHHLQVPGPATKEVVLKVLRQEMKKAGVTGEPQRFFLAARTGVATDVWVYWQNRRVILQISGDMDIIDPAVIPHLPLLVRQFNLGSNVVASVLEAEGSNALITRDRASRVVFMCVVRGEENLLAPAAGS